MAILDGFNLKKLRQIWIEGIKPKTTEQEHLAPWFFLKHQLNQSKVWITRPDLSLGSNQVVLGGMMLLVSAMSMICFFFLSFSFGCWKEIVLLQKIS